MTRKPRLLLFAYYFPPANAIGAVRAYNIAKWLTRRGWEVTVVTLSSQVWRNADETQATDAALAHEGIRCIRTDHRWRLLSPGHLLSPASWPWLVAGGISRRSARLAGFEMETGWMREAERACAGLVEEDVDLILATGSPFGSFDLARRLARRLGRPFVLDYRDLWTANPHATSESSQNKQRLEEELLEECGAVIAVSPGVAETLRERFSLERSVHVVTNGYDPEELASVDAHEFGHFAIVYAGVFYPPKRVITPIMAALSRLERIKPKTQSNWVFHYYGWHTDHVAFEASRYGVADRVAIHGLQARRKVLSAVKGAGVSVVIASVEEAAKSSDRGIVTGKVFDAIGLGTPMLVVAPQGSDLDVIVKTAGRGVRFTGAQIDEMVSFLAEAIDGRVPPRARPEVFAWPALSAELDRVLRGAAGLHQGTSPADGTDPTARRSRLEERKADARGLAAR